MSWTDPEFYPVGKEPLRFRYNRADRLDRAPKLVRDYYEGKMNLVTNPTGKKTGFFGTLLSTPARRMTMLTIAFLALALVIASKW